MWGHHRRLARDLQRWTDAGWVTPEGARLIRAEIEKAPRLRLPGVLAILASVLLAFAVMSFVGAHWDEIPRLARLTLLICGLVWGGYAAAGLFHAKGQHAISDAAILFAVSAFGASIMLISQMYHIDGNPPDGVLLWWLGALMAGVLLRSNPALTFTMVLAGLWSLLTLSEQDGTHWPFLVPWALVTAAFVWQGWRPGIYVSGVAMAIFAISLGYTMDMKDAHAAVVALGVAGAGLAIAGERTRPEWEPLWPAVFDFSAVTAYAGLFALQFIKDPSNQTLAIFSAISLALLLALIWHGLSAGKRGALWLGYLGFSIEILALYAKTVGTLLDTSLFFLVAGLLFAALAYVAWRLHERRGAEAVS